MNDKKSMLGVIVMNVLVGTIIGTTIPQVSWAVVHTEPWRGNAPIATSGDNIYITWWTNKTGNDEVMFRASTDNGATFGDKINLSNSTNAESVNASIAAEGDHVYVSWWERNATSNEPVLKISNDNGKTFGPILKLGANETIGSSGGG